MRAYQLLSAACLTGLAACSSLLTNTEDRLGSRETSAQYEGYMFVYFTGNTIQGEKIYFAASNGNNALDWRELNGGQPVLSSTQGTKGLRDPFIIRSADGSTFYLLATDLSIGSGTSWHDSVHTGSRYLEGKSRFCCRYTTLKTNKASSMGKQRSCHLVGTAPCACIA